MKSIKVQGVVEYFLDNLFDILTVSAAGYLVVHYRLRSVGDSDIPKLLLSVLSVLGLIAISGLWDRDRRLRRIEKLSEESRDLIHGRLKGVVYAHDFLHFEPQLCDLPATTFEEATTIYLSGMTLGRSIRQYDDVLRRRFMAGATIRMIILDPTKEFILEELVKRSADNTTNVDYWRDRLQNTEMSIRAIGQVGNGHGKLEIGFLPYIPSFGAVIVDPRRQHAVCYVELYHHRSTGPQAAFELRRSDDSEWFKYFFKQFDMLWESCRKDVLEVSQNSSQGA